MIQIDFFKKSQPLVGEGVRSADVSLKLQPDNRGASPAMTVGSQKEN